MDYGYLSAVHLRPFTAHVIVQLTNSIYSLAQPPFASCNHTVAQTVRQFQLCPFFGGLSSLQAFLVAPNALLCLHLFFYHCSLQKPFEDGFFQGPTQRFLTPRTTVVPLSLTCSHSVADRFRPSCNTRSCSE